MDKTEFVIGTRESELAIIQAKQVYEMLSKGFPNLNFKLSGFTTTGDKIQSVALSKIGQKSLFTKELEVALEAGKVDLIVHSLKDLPTTLPPGMALSAVMERKDPRDSVVMSLKNSKLTLKQLPPGSVVGTSSVRRIAQLKKSFPHLEFRDIVIDLPFNT
jgi:hydroxymethylbilane synthase